MRHIILDKGWDFSKEPFPAYRIAMVYGHNKRCRRHIGVNGVNPNKKGVLPENGFQVAKHKKNHSIIIVPGEDNTNRCLLFVGCYSDFRGSAKVLEEVTTGKIIETCQAGNAMESRISVVVILEPGQSVVFHSYGRNFNRVKSYTWNGEEIESKDWTKQEWDRRNDPKRSEENINWLPGNYRIFELSGNRNSEGITLDDKGNLTGMDELFVIRRLLAYGFKISPKEQLKQVRFGRDMHNELVIAPANGEISQERCAVLVHESIGSTKRRPGFYIDWENAGKIERLKCICQGKTKGQEYSLILAPLNWAENISAQFVDEKDYPDQTIGYKPDRNFTPLPNPFKGQGRAIAKAITTLLGSSQAAYYILKAESEALYGRARRQDALRKNIPGIESDPVASSLIYVSQASKLDNLLTQTLIALWEDFEEEAGQEQKVEEETVPMEHTAPKGDFLAALAERFNQR